MMPSPTATAMYAAEDTLRVIASVIRDEGERDPAWTLEEVRAAIGRGSARGERPPPVA
jgi:hypothetical protein